MARRSPTSSERNSKVPPCGRGRCAALSSEIRRALREYLERDHDEREETDVSGSMGQPADRPTADDAPDRPENYLGSIGSLRPATAKADDDGEEALRRGQPRGLRAPRAALDSTRPAGQAYRVQRAAVLESLDPRRHASTFCVADGLLVFLRREGEDSVEIGEVVGRVASGNELLRSAVSGEVY